MIERSYGVNEVRTEAPGWDEARASAFAQVEEAVKGLHEISFQSTTNSHEWYVGYHRAIERAVAAIADLRTEGGTE